MLPLRQWKRINAVGIRLRYAMVVQKMRNIVIQHGDYS